MFRLYKLRIMFKKVKSFSYRYHKSSVADPHLQYYADPGSKKCPYGPGCGSGSKGVNSKKENLH